MLALASAFLLLLASTTTSAVQMSTISTYEGQTCAGDAVFEFPYAPVSNACSSNRFFNTSQRFACATHEFWLTSSTCSGNASITTQIPAVCYPDLHTGRSYKYTCRDFNNVVRVTFQSGTCGSESAAVFGTIAAPPAVSSVYLELDKCNPIAGRGFSDASSGLGTHSLNYDRSYMVSAKPGGQYAFTYYRTANCTGDAKLEFNPVANGGCSSMDGTSAGEEGMQSATVTTVDAAPRTGGSSFAVANAGSSTLVVFASLVLALVQFM